MLQRLIELLRPDVSTEAKLTGVSLFLGKSLDKFDSRLNTMETKILIPLKDGKDGKDGKIGAKGLNGKDGKSGKDGKDGEPGKDGKPGLKGDKGVSVVDAEVAVDDHLVLKLSNGKIIDAGELPKTKSGETQHIISTQVAQDQITVSDTAPEDPQLNALWFDTSECVDTSGDADMAITQEMIEHLEFILVEMKLLNLHLHELPRALNDGYNYAEDDINIKNELINEQ